MPFDKIKDYVEDLFNVFHILNNKSDQIGDRKSKYIAIMIYNYMVKTAKDNNIDLIE
jgi:DNA phosphorothioation-dependent restriction protein DptG